ncbi:MAG: DUF3300 domain-containing protein [Candidatus Korobacteraceae bacterium]
MKFLRQTLSLVLSCCIGLATVPNGLAYQADQPSSQAPVVNAPQTPAELQQLVAPIALYPDSLVAQILAASTYPAEIVEADRWMQQHTNLEGDQLGQAVNTQSWDPSVKALTEFPMVLANMDKNLSWTSSLGDAYINQPQDVMNAIQTMRARAKQAGNLNNTSQQTVTQLGQDIWIEPANPKVIYVPEYDPWLVYGAPVVVWPGWYSYPGLFLAGPGIAFGLSFGVGFLGGFGWGWRSWGYDWHGHNIIYNHNTYVSHSSTFVNRNYYANRERGNYDQARGFHGAGGLGNYGSHGFPAPEHGFASPEHEFASPQQGFAEPKHAFAAPQSLGHPGAFSGFNQGGVTRSYSSRGQSSFGGGFHGG